MDHDVISLAVRPGMEDRRCQHLQPTTISKVGSANTFAESQEESIIPPRSTIQVWLQASKVARSRIQAVLQRERCKGPFSKPF